MEEGMPRELLSDCFGQQSLFAAPELVRRPACRELVRHMRIHPPTRFPQVDAPPLTPASRAACKAVFGSLIARTAPFAAPLGPRRGRSARAPVRTQLWWLDSFCLRAVQQLHRLAIVEVPAPGEPPCVTFRLVDGLPPSTCRWVLLERRHNHVDLLGATALSWASLLETPLMEALLRAHAARAEDATLRGPLLAVPGRGSHGAGAPEAATACADVAVVDAVAAESGEAEDEAALWYGSRRAMLVAAPGTTEAFGDGTLVLDHSEAALLVTLARARPLPPPDGCADGPPVVVPAMPCVELRLDAADAAADDAPLPPSLASPLIKTALPLARPAPGAPTRLPSDGCVHALASGVRSALVPLDGAWYRLKGCGNGDGGFDVRCHGASREVRGSAFLHTARRELFVARELAPALAAAGCASANEPLGLWRYSGACAPFGEEDVAQTACAIERTRGDRRLGTHVLSGLALLLPRLLGLGLGAPAPPSGGMSTGGEGPAWVSEGVEASSVASDGDDVARLLALFPPDRPSGLEVETAALMTDAMLAFELAASDREGANEGCAGAPHGLSWPELPRVPALFADATRAGAVLRERVPDRFGVAADAAAHNEYPQQWTHDGAQPMAVEWRPRWCAACASLHAVLAELHAAGRHEASVLGYAYARLGRECGTMLRAMHDAGYSWGTYQDALCHDGQWHCNAHSNNVVVLSEAQGVCAAAAMPAAADGARPPPPMTACLDFDMAFDARSYVDMASGRVGAESPAAFAELLARERLNFAEVLAGGDATSGVPQVAMRELDAQPDAVRVARTLLNDTLLRSFLTAYDGGELCAEDAPFDALLHRGAYAILRMAIVVMAECVA